MKLKTIAKIFISLIILTALLAGGAVAFYLKGLPNIVSNPKTINYVQDLAKKYTNVDLVIKKPVLKTEFSPNISFNVDKVYLTKDKKRLFELNKFSTELSFEKILSKSIKIKKLVAQSIFADVNGIQSILPQTEKKEQKSEWDADIFDALLGVQYAEVIYMAAPDTKIHFKGEHIGVNNAQKDKRNVYIQTNTLISRNDKQVHINFKDNEKVFFEDNHFHVKNCPIEINKSKIYINFDADKKKNYDLTLFSNKFNIQDVLDFLNTQIIENNIQDSLVYLNDIQGNIDFKLNIKNSVLNGDFILNNAKFKIRDVDNVPITLTKGKVKLTPTTITLNDFEGYYDNNNLNKIKFEGSVKDYLRTIDTNIVGSAIVRNDFFKNHLSKMLGTNIAIKGEAPTRITFKSKNNIMDFVWLFMLKPGENIKVANDFLPFEDTLRIMRSDMHLQNMILDIKSLDYHMIPKDEMLTREQLREMRARGEKPKAPIFKLKSKIDLAHNSDLKFLSFEIPEPLPSEILNAVMKQEFFKRGKISGKMSMNKKGKYPVLNGTMSMDKVIIPSQMTFVKEATMQAKEDMIHLDAKGGYRYAKFSFNGDILNQIKFPMIIKDVNLSLENIDTFKLLEEFNNQTQSDNVIATNQGNIKVENNSGDFDIRNIIIEKGKFHLDKGTYKDIAFGNLDADITLDKNGVVDIKSNRFDFAEGKSSLKAIFDLVNKKYNVKLGVLNSNSDTIANALLDLKREITGKGSGFLDISTDDSGKLSGTIKFIVKDGTIEKIGLVEYVLKCASLLRNTVTMLSPAIFADIVNVPEGNFDKITGELILDKNVVTGIKIKTYSPQLSTYISGRYNIDNGDTSLRIYTKFSSVKKGFTGFLRKISLDALANRLPINSRNDTNYYAIELAELPEIEANEKDCQIYLTRVEGDVVHNNYISSLKKLK